MFLIKIDPFRRDIPHFEIMRPMRIFRGIPQFPRSSRIQGKGSSGGLWGWGWRAAGAFARWAGGRRWMGDRPVIDSVEVYNMINMYIMIYLISKYIQYIYIEYLYIIYISMYIFMCTFICIKHINLNINKYTVRIKYTYLWLVMVLCLLTRV